jgi:3-hydroxy-9,10-secoandrosta-1,3,5(10)-triene-9,17-dione monooxygenase reductase component
MSIDGARYRQVLGHFPTGVTVITGLDPNGEPTGLTIGSFTSVSLDPPLVGFLPAVTSKSWPAIQQSGAFCVNVLGHDQADLCWRFAKETEGRYKDLAWTPGPTGSPILDGVAAWIDCTIEHVYEMGDHLFVLGRVVELAHADDVSNAMIFFRGKVGGFGAPPSPA